MKYELTDPDLERSVLKSIIQIDSFSKYVLTYDIVDESHFTELYHIDVFNSVKRYYNKYGIAPDQKKLKQYLLKNITRVKEFKDESIQIKIWMNGLNKFYSELSESEKRESEANLNLLDELRKARVLQSHLLTSYSYFKKRDFDKILTNVNEMQKSLKKYDNVIMEGNLIDDFKQHLQIMKQKELGLDTPVKFNVVGAIENMDTGEFDIVEFDDLLGGGSFNGEMTLLVGENNVGKSFVLLHCAISPAIKNKKNTIMFSIEMNKIKQEWRAYSYLTRIPFIKFKLAELTKKEKRIWKNKVEWMKSEAGIFHIVSYDKGATAIDISNKIDEAENRYGEKFDLCVIDYLNDMTPVGNFKSGKDWDAQGEISWDLAQLSKYHNNHMGIPIITANQKKTSRAGSSTTGWDDAAFSPLPTQHATVGIGLGQDQTDKAIKRIRWDLWKARDGDKNISFYTYPRFDISRIFSVKRMNEYYDLRDQEQEDEEQSVLE